MGTKHSLILSVSLINIDIDMLTSILFSDYDKYIFYSLFLTMVVSLPSLYVFFSVSSERKLALRPAKSEKKNSHNRYF